MPKPMPPMPPIPEQPVPPEQFNPEVDLKGIMDWLDEVPSEEGEVPATEGEVQPAGQDVTLLVTAEMSPEEIKQMVMENLDAFIAYLQSIGTPRDWPKDILPHVRQALMEAWDSLTKAEQRSIAKAIKSTPPQVAPEGKPLATEKKA